MIAPSKPRRRLSGRCLASVLALILGAHLALLSYCAVSKSICVDERGHISAGLAYLKFHEFSIYNLSPPLARIWMALPAYFDGADIPPARRYQDMPARNRHWMYAIEFEQSNWPHMQRYVVMGRFMAIPLSLGAAIVIFLWARKLYGDQAALVACAAWSFSPLVIAHGSTLGTDMPTTFFMLLAVYAWCLFTERTERVSPGSFRVLLLAAIAAGAANATKFTGLLLWPILLGICALRCVQLYRARRPTRWPQQLAGLLICAVISFVIVNASTEFRLMGDSINKFDFDSSFMKSLQHALPGWMPIPFHRAVIEGFDAQKWEADDVYSTTLFNRAHFGSNWLYYPWTALCKTTVGGLALAALCLVSLKLKRARAIEWPLLVVVGGAGLGMYLTARINISLRYMLPIYPALIILLSRSITIRRLRPLTIVACLALVVESGLAAPRYHSFSNWLVTPWRNYVPDLDFGQSLLDLKTWMHDNGQPRICLISFTPPEPYDIANEDPLAGPVTTDYVALSRNALDGLPFHTRTRFYLVRGWRKLRHTTPAADLGGIVIFRTEDVIHSADDGGPWVSEVHSWEEAMKDPALIPIDNFDARKAKGF